MKRRTIRECLRIWQIEEERQAPKRHSAETSVCLGWKKLEDYAAARLQVDREQLHSIAAHILDCRYCTVRLVAFAEEHGLTREQVLANVKRDAELAVSQPSRPRPVPAPSYAWGAMSPAMVEFITQTQKAIPFLWRRESGETVKGELSFDQVAEGKVEPHVFLRAPLAHRLTFKFAYEDESRQVVATELTIASDGHSEPCFEEVPIERLEKGFKLEPPDGEIEWQNPDVPGAHE